MFTINNEKLKRVLIRDLGKYALVMGSTCDIRTEEGKRNTIGLCMVTCLREELGADVKEVNGEGLNEFINARLDYLAKEISLDLPDQLFKAYSDLVEAVDYDRYSGFL